MTPGRHLTRRVVRYEHDGTATVLADNFGGTKLNSPNDVVAHPDGSCWFTDPPYGGQLYEGEPDVAGGKGDMSVFDVGTDNKLSDQKRFSDFMVDGVKCGPDGVRCDVNGNVWASSNAGRAVGYSGVTIWNPDGKLIGRIRLPEVCGNICTRRLLHAAQSWLWLDCRGCSRCALPCACAGSPQPPRALRRAGPATHDLLVQLLIDDLDRAVDLGIGRVEVMRNQLHQQIDPLDERRTGGHRARRR